MLIEEAERPIPEDQQNLPQRHRASTTGRRRGDRVLRRRARWQDLPANET